MIRSQEFKKLFVGANINFLNAVAEILIELLEREEDADREAMEAENVIKNRCRATEERINATAEAEAAERERDRREQAEREAKRKQTELKEKNHDK